MEYLNTAELTVLSDIFRDDTKIAETIDVLNEQDFENKFNAAIFKAMRNLFNRSAGIDPLTVAAELDPETLKGLGGMATLFKIQSISESPESIKQHMAIVKDASNRKAITRAAREIALKAEQGGDPLELISEFNGLFSKTGVAGEGRAKNILNAVDEFFINGENKEKPILTGYKVLDRVTGGIRRGEYTIIAARPSMGKTALLLNIIKGMDIEEKILFFSMEMTTETVLNRWGAAASGLDLAEVSNGNYKRDEASQRAFEDGLARIAGRGNIFIDDTRGLTVEQIKARIKREKAEHGITVVCIDHMQKIKLNGKKTLYEGTTEASNQLHAIAGELDVAVILLSQLKRTNDAGAERAPELHHLRNSGGLEEDADRVILLHRADYYERIKPPVSELQVIIAKNRNGETGTVIFDYILKNQRMKER